MIHGVRSCPQNVAMRRDGSTMKNCLSNDRPDDKLPDRAPLHPRKTGMDAVESLGKYKNMNAALALRAVEAPESSLQPALRECVSRAVRRYLHDMDGRSPDGLYELVLQEVEGPLLREVMSWAGGNQSRAAAALGINRATLRKKLAAQE